MSLPLVEMEQLVVQFKARKRLLARSHPPVRAVDHVSLALADGEILGLVGESGCGKTTLAKTLLGIQRETSGTIRLGGQMVSAQDPAQARISRRDIQYVHQDPGAALDPWWRIGDTLHEGLKINGIQDKAERTRRIEEMLSAVGLDQSFSPRYPHELSGGQQRRVGLARILVLKPRVVLLDEPTSGLDLSVQATVLRLIRDLRTEFGLTYLFISHDLSVVRRMCNRVAIMYLGKIVEIGAREEVFSRPLHPYTRALLAASPRLESGQIQATDALKGDPPSASARPEGCAFHNRCPMAIARCASITPKLEPIGTGSQQAACIRLHELHPAGGARSASQ